ncbi:MAG: hypothetical protein JOZ27_04290, partial [Caulobacteraceae bacterium]|nr:hypothetical protein [Caulobacteraceae bacterium]
SLNRPTSDLRSWDLYLRALIHFRTYQRAEMEKAVELLDRALELDPNYALALSLAASAHAIIMQFQWTDDPARHGRLVVELMERSLRTGSDDPQVLSSAAMGYWTAGDFATAARLADRAVALNPGSSLPLLAKGQLSIALGDVATAETCIEQSMRLDPLSPSRTLQLGALGAIRFAQRRFAETADIAREWMNLANHPLSAGLLAASAGHLGDGRLARQGLDHLKEVSAMPRETIAAMLYQTPEHRALLLEGMALADGL